MQNCIDIWKRSGDGWTYSLFSFKSCVKEARSERWTNLTNIYSLSSWFVTKKAHIKYYTNFIMFQLWQVSSSQVLHCHKNWETIFFLIVRKIKKQFVFVAICEDVQVAINLESSRWPFPSQRQHWQRLTAFHKIHQKIKNP